MPELAFSWQRKRLPDHFRLSLALSSGEDDNEKLCFGTALPLQFNMKTVAVKLFEKPDQTQGHTLPYNRSIVTSQVRCSYANDLSSSSGKPCKPLHVKFWLFFLQNAVPFHCNERINIQGSFTSNALIWTVFRCHISVYAKSRQVLGKSNGLQLIYGKKQSLWHIHNITACGNAVDWP